MEKILRAHLLATSAVTDLVGTKINFGVHPQGAGLPGVVLTTVTDAQGSFLGSPDGLSAATVQVDCYAEDYGAVKGLARAVRGALSGWSGSGVQGVIELALRDGFEGDVRDGPRPFRVSLDYQVIYTIQEA